MRKYLADTTAMIIFSTIVGLLIEVVIVGLTLRQSASIRVAAIPVMLLAGRPYGIYRDYLLKYLPQRYATDTGRATIDTLANVSFQTALYLILLVLNGATVQQILAAIGIATVINLIAGRPYGLFLDYWRKLLHAEAN